MTDSEKVLARLQGILLQARHVNQQAWETHSMLSPDENDQMPSDMFDLLREIESILAEIWVVMTRLGKAE